MKRAQSILLGFLLVAGSFTPLDVLAVSHAGITTRATRAKKEPRHYHIPATSSQEKGIAYIVNTLAFKGLIDIGFEKSTLEKTGYELENLHPLNFLKVIFKKKQLQVGAAAIRERTGWIKDGFYNGIIRSLGEEAAKQNLLPFVGDFAKEVKIDVKLISPPLEKGKWKEFINILIDKVPRDDNQNRYNM